MRLLLLAGLALLLGAPDRPAGKDSTRVNIDSPKGMKFGPVQAHVRITIDNPTEEWYCPSVEVEYPGLYGVLRATFEEDCAPWEEWVSADDVLAIRGGKLIRERPEKRWSYTWRGTLYAGPNPIVIRLQQGKETRTMGVQVPVL